jgi:sec-independent protein translocase protein TatB
VFNVGIGEIAVIVLVCLIVFGPERLPQMARQTGRFLGQLRLMTQGALDQLKQEADLKDINLPELRVGSLRTQARDYVRELLDIEGQMADLEREREEIKANLESVTEADSAAANGAAANGSGSNGSTPGAPTTEGTAPAAAATTVTSATTATASPDAASPGPAAAPKPATEEPAPVDPEAT